MATLKDTFNGVITEAIKNAELISDNYQKAMVYATVAQALAATGMVAGDTTEMVEPAKKEAKKAAKPKKTADKMKRQPEEIPVEEETTEEEPAVEETVAEEAAEEAQEWTDEWTEEAIEAFENELEYISQFADKYGAEGANQCLADFSNGKLTDIAEDITPMNIKAIAAAFKEYEAAA